jgi:hypothetical protein
MDSLHNTTDYIAEEFLFDSRQGQEEICLFSKPSRPSPGPAQAPLRKIIGELLSVVTRTGRETDHSPPSNAEGKNEWSYTSTPPCAFIVYKEVTYTFILLNFTATYMFCGIWSNLFFFFSQRKEREYLVSKHHHFIQSMHSQSSCRQKFTEYCAPTNALIVYHILV